MPLRSTQVLRKGKVSLRDPCPSLHEALDAHLTHGPGASWSSRPPRSPRPELSPAAPPLAPARVGGAPKRKFLSLNQDQPLDCVDFGFLGARLRQNSAAEKLTSLWLDHLFERREVQQV